MLKINFLVPTTGLTGGIKAIFWHVNNLAQWGYQIAIIHPLVLSKNPSFIGRLKGVLKFFKYLFLKIISQDKVKHFDLDKRIKIYHVWNLSENFIPLADITVATANETADWLAEYSSLRGQKFYFIQDYENWTRKSEEVDATWKMPLKKIVIASWLKNLAKEKFQENIYGLVPNGIDLSIFYPESRIVRQPKRILMQYHCLAKKGIADGLKAFKIAKARYPELELWLYGAYRPPRDVLKISKFFYCPPAQQVRKIFSACDIFLWPSLIEGFGIPPMEAMACGCALIATDTGAIRDYAVNDESVIIVPPGQPEMLAKKLLELLADSEKINRLTATALVQIKNFSWEKSSKKLEETFLTALKS
jgi:glycosyltransferase involved in cell wall biosynthesis